MLIGMAIFAIFLSTVGRWFLETYRQQQALRSVAASGGGVLRYDVRASDSRSWLYHWIGYDPFEGVREIGVNTDQAQEALIARSKQFKDIEMLAFGSGITVAGYKQVGQLNKFPKLRIGEWIEELIDSDGLQHFGQWTKVRDLFFNGCPTVTDASSGTWSICQTSKGFRSSRKAGAWRSLMPDWFTSGG
jgi:hypothetical protein